LKDPEYKDKLFGESQGITDNDVDMRERVITREDDREIETDMSKYYFEGVI
jgi:hypothetical protein